MSNILPRDLPASDTVNPNSVTIIDGGATVNKATPIQLMDAARPLSSQSEAEIGADNVKLVSPLRTKQAINALSQKVPFRLDTTFDTGTLGARLLRKAYLTDSPFNGSGDGVANDTAAVTGAEGSSYDLIYLPPGRYSTTLTPYQAVNKRYHGEGQIVMGGFGQARERSMIVSPQPTPNQDRTKFFDSGFKKAHRASYSFVGAGANPSTLPSIYTNYSEWSSDLHIHDFTAGFNKDPADHAVGRSGAWKEEVRLYHGGQGDLAARHFYGEAYSTRSGATHWLATPALIVENGNLGAIASTGCVYLNHSEYIYSDSGNDIAVIDHVRNFVRTNRTGAIGQVWGYLRPQSAGSQFVDFVLSPSGKFWNGLDFSCTELGPSKGAVVLKAFDRICYNGVSTPDGLGAKFYAQDCGNTFTYFDSTQSRLITAVGGVAVLQPSASDVYMSKPAILTLDATGSLMFGNSQAMLYAISNTQIGIKYRGTDGVTRSGVIATIS